MPRKKTTEIPVTSYLVLALLAESAAHGYELERLVVNRGFRMWTDLGKSSIYLALKQLLREEMILVRFEAGEGPIRKVYRITEYGRKVLAQSGARFLAEPRNPRNEIDLGIYALPFMPLKEARRAVVNALSAGEAKEEFLTERLRWCEKNKLALPALSFERPLLALQAEMKWLRIVQQKLTTKASSLVVGWESYVYREAL